MHRKKSEDKDGKCEAKNENSSHLIAVFLLLLWEMNSWNIATPYLQCNNILLKEILIPCLSHSWKFLSDDDDDDDDDDPCPPQLAASAQVALDEEEIQARSTRQNTEFILRTLCNTLRNEQRNSMLLEIRNTPFMLRDRLSILYALVAYMYFIHGNNMCAVMNPMYASEIKSFILLTKNNSFFLFAKIVEIMEDIFETEHFSMTKISRGCGKKILLDKNHQMPHNLENSFQKTWIGSQIVNNSSKLRLFAPPIDVFMVRYPSTSGNERGRRQRDSPNDVLSNEGSRRQRDSPNDVLSTGGKNLHSFDIPLPANPDAKVHRKSSRKRSQSLSDATEYVPEQPIKISSHVESGGKQTKDLPRYFQKGHRKTWRNRSKSHSDVIDYTVEPHINIGPHKTGQNLNSEERLRIFQEEGIHFKSDDLFWSGTSPFPDQYQYQIQTPLETDCPRCLKVMDSAFRLTQDQLNSIRASQKTPLNDSLNFSEKDLYRQWEENQSAATPGDQRPCYHYSVVHAEKSTVQNFLRCHYHRHLEEHCGVLVQNELGKISKRNGRFREGYEYQKLKVLGKGTYGTVHLCRIITKLGSGFEFVTKTIKEHVFNEEEIEVPLEHGNYCDQILEIYGIIKCGDEMLLVMEYAKGGTLSSLEVGRDMPIMNLVTITYYLLLGLQYLHNAGICIYDIKGDNIVLRRQNDPKSVAFIDWGSAKYLDLEFQNKNFNNGTRKFYPPERRRNISIGHLRSHDMWTLGCALFSCLRGQRLFKMMENLKNQSFDHLICTDCNVIKKELCYIDQSIHGLCPAMVDLLYGLLRMDPRDRISSSDALTHRLFSTNEIQGTYISSLRLPLHEPWRCNVGGMDYFSEDSKDLVKVSVTLKSALLFVTFVAKGTPIQRFIQDRSFTNQIQPFIQSRSGYYLKERTTKRNALRLVEDVELELELVT